jgi:hypothetical protein
MHEKPEKPEHLPAGPVSTAEPDAVDAFLARLRAEAGRPVYELSLRDWVAAAAAETSAGPSRVGWWRRKVGAPMAAWKRRLATAVASLVLVIGGMSGLAWAANGSVPGNALYGLDRALEHVGIGGGGTVERLAEVQGLIEAGDIPGGLSHAGELVAGEAEGSEEGGASASEALQAAASRVAEAGSEVSTNVHEHVAALLTYLSENVGQVDGRQVATLARQIGGNENPPGSGPPDGVPPADPPGPSDDVPVGRPEGVPPGPPGNVPPVEPGPPNGVPPEYPGPPRIPLPDPVP